MKTRLSLQRCKFLLSCFDWWIFSICCSPLLTTSSSTPSMTMRPTMTLVTRRAATAMWSRDHSMFSYPTVTSRLSPTRWMIIPDTWLTSSTMEPNIPDTIIFKQFFNNVPVLNDQVPNERSGQEWEGKSNLGRNYRKLQLVKYNNSSNFGIASSGVKVQIQMEALYPKYSYWDIFE